MPAPEKPHRILLVNPFGVGDVIFTMPLAEVLRKSGALFIGFVGNERTADLVRMNTAIDRTYVFDRDRYRKLWKKNPLLFYRELSAFLSLIREEHYDAMLDLSLGRQYSFFAFFLGIRERIGFNYKGRGIFLTKKIALDGYDDRPVAETQLGLLSLAGIPNPGEVPPLSLKVPESARIEAMARLRTHGFHQGDRILAVAPGGGRSWGENSIYKQWDPEYFAAAANEYCGSFPSPKKVILLGDGSETELLEKVRALLKVHAVTISSAALDEAAALLLHCGALLCNDGGLMHLANALGVRTVSVFGPVDERVYGPFGGSEARVVLTQDVPCRPCYAKFRFPPCPYARRCLHELPVEAAVAALKKIA